MSGLTVSRTSASCSRRRKRWWTHTWTSICACFAGFLAWRSCRHPWRGCSPGYGAFLRHLLCFRLDSYRALTCHHEWETQQRRARVENGPQTLLVPVVQTLSLGRDEMKRISRIRTAAPHLLRLVTVSVPESRRQQQNQKKLRRQTERTNKHGTSKGILVLS